MDYTVVEAAMAYAEEEHGVVPTVVLSGKARGVDTLGEEWARARNIPVEDYPANWDDVEAEGAIVRTRPDGSRYNLVAGFWRNEEMAQNADALVAVVTGSSGTADMVRRAKFHKLVIVRYRL